MSTSEPTAVPSAPSAGRPYLGDTKHSPIRLFAIGSLVFAILSAGFLAAYAPRPAPLGPPAGFLLVSVLLLLATAVGLVLRTGFAWGRFFSIAKFVVMMTVVISAMLEYVFVFDGMRGAALAIMSIVLAVTAIDIPILWGFAVARHERVSTQP
jgi:hypothetical protein